MGEGLKTAALPFRPTTVALVAHRRGRIPPAGPRPHTPWPPPFPRFFPAWSQSHSVPGTQAAR